LRNNYHILLILIAFSTSTLLSCSSEESDAVVDTTSFEKYKQNIEANHSLGHLTSDKTAPIKFKEMALKPTEYANWVNQRVENPLIRTKKISEFNYSMKYLPLEFMICNELRKEEISQVEYDSLVSNYEGMEYYEMRIQIDDFNDETAKYQVADMGVYQQRIMYMSFAMQDNINIELSEDLTAPCKLYHFERTYGVAPYATILMGFSKEDLPEMEEERTIVFEDKLFNKGLIKFNWSMADLNNVPKIEVL
jgi:hypothetical protein